MLGGQLPDAAALSRLPGNVGVADEDPDLIAHIALPIGPAMLMRTDAVGGELVGNNTHMVMEADDAAEARRLFDARSAGGRATVPLRRTSGPTSRAR